MTTIYQLVVSAGIALLAFGLWKLSKILYRRWSSPLRSLPGPKSSHWFFGNVKEIFNADNSVLHEQWQSEYGDTFKYHFIFNEARLCTMDTKAINHVLTHSFDYQKGEAVRRELAQILGTGVLNVEGDQHKQQRKIMNPAFGPVQIRALTEIMTAKANQLRDVWAAEIEKSDYKGRLDAMQGLSKMTLDVIGQAGFNYDFDALNPEGRPNELNEAFSTIFRSGMQLNIKLILMALLKIPSERARQIATAQKTMNRIGRKLLAESKAAVAVAEKDGEQETSQNRDLLSLLVRANTAKDIPENQRLSDADVVAQVPTFLVAGHETSSTAVTWTLFALTQNAAVQTKLREELLTIPTDTPSMEQLSELSYLDAVVREALRIHPPVSATTREAMKDDLIPLEKPFIDNKGVTQTAIKVSKGDSIFIPILAINRSEKIWGDDAKEFKPERWEATPDGAHKIPGIWGNQLTFLGGPRACIGYKFSLIEIKAILFALVRAFEFELAVPAEDVVSKQQTIVLRPFVTSEPDSGSQLPLIVKPYRS